MSPARQGPRDYNPAPCRKSGGPDKPTSPPEIGQKLPPSTEEVASAKQIDVAVTSPAGPEIAQHLQSRGCPVCDYLHRVAFDFLSQWQYALSTDDRIQVEFASELGFCPPHAWQLEAVSSPTGSATGYVNLVEHISRTLAHAASSPAGEQSVRALLRVNRSCRVCRLLRDAEQRYIGCLAIFIAEPEGQEVYSHAQGPCLRHLAGLVAVTKDAEIVAYLLGRAAGRFERLAENMEVFAAKISTGDRALCNNDEKDAYWRAITRIVGAKGVVVPLQEEPQ